MSVSLTAEIAGALGPPGGGPLVLVAVGNVLRADDGAGPAVAARVPSRPGLTVLDAGDRPEDIPFHLENTDAGRIVILDAADFGGEPGELRIIPPEHIPETMLSTHAVSLAVVFRLLQKQTDAPVVFIGIQPARLDHVEGLSPAVEATVSDIVAFLEKEFPRG